MNSVSASGPCAAQQPVGAFVFGNNAVSFGKLQLHLLALKTREPSASAPRSRGGFAEQTRIPRAGVKPAAHGVKPQRDISLKDGRVSVVFFEPEANYR
ncbi:hypothetical protein AV530_013792 [Patagioenas fasciata monilis]|uniref:Uncharacterized protein n=1 Tax=Patagioenas fasciata monilis TaxID=372326 RepID=A0A1V4J8F5_PATFA|nr:hypothetical protein AV530_013792 [Patagioenas fasciata monilis]